ncbi:MAG: T9SS type A sorting domain-containing protein, partial [Chitinophagales bacterium]
SEDIPIENPGEETYFQSSGWGLDSEVFILKFGDSTVTVDFSEPISIVSDLILYPNPANNYVIVELTADQTEKLNMRIKDISGKTVSSGEYEMNRGVNKIKLDTKYLPAGIYLVQVQGYGFSSSMKFIRKD